MALARRPAAGSAHSPSGVGVPLSSSAGDPGTEPASDPGSTVTTSSQVDLPPEAPSGSHRAPGKPAGSPLAALQDRRYVQPAIVAVGILVLAIAYYAQA